MADPNFQEGISENSPERKPKKNFWGRVGDGAKWLYDSAKKIFPQVRYLDEAFHSEDPLKITSTVLNEGGKLIGGDIGKAMRFGHGITNIAGSDNAYDGAAEGITSAMRYADFGKEGNRLAENLSSGLHHAANSQRINQKIRQNINENIAKARRQYEYAQAVENGEYDDALDLEIRRMQAANARRRINENQYAKPADDEYDNIQSPETALDLNTLQTSDAPQKSENEKPLSDAEKLTALRTTPARTSVPRQPRPMQNTQQAVPVREVYTH